MYPAFISYSHKDKKWAEWLHHAIEYYKLPDIVRENHGKYLRPIFWDKSDLTPRGGLRVSLRRGLEASRHLIVICSPASARPNEMGEHWVNNEVLEFQRLGRSDHIIPFIIEGIPNALDPKNECYPPALRQIPDLPLGVSILESGKKDALLRVIAALVEIDFDELKQRHGARARRNRILFLVAVLTLILGLGWFHDVNYREKTEYYADYVERLGVPEGIHKLTAMQIAKRHEHYRITKKGGRVVRLVHANSTGRHIHHESDITDVRSNRPAVAWYEYDEKGQLLRVRYQNVGGKMLPIDHLPYQAYSENRKNLEFRYSKDDSSSPFALPSDVNNPRLEAHSKQISHFLLPSHFFEQMVFGSTRRSVISLFKLTYDDNGFVITNKFAKNIDDVASNGNIFGYKIKLDDYGRTVELTYLDEKGQPVETRRGEGGQQYTYNDEGSITNMTHVNRYGKPTLIKAGYAAIERQYNEQGNEILRKYLDAEGNPVLHWDGYVAIKREYDEQGNEIRRTYLDRDSKPTLIRAGYAAIDRKYDDQGNNKLWIYLDKEFKPISCEDGYVGAKREYGKWGNEIRRTYLDSNHEPTLHNKGDYTSIEWEYKSSGNMPSSYTYFGLDGKRTLTKNGGYARAEREYDGRGNEILRKYFDVDGKLVLRKGNYAAVKRKYDERSGNEVLYTHVGLDERPTLIEDGYASIRTEYDGPGNGLLQEYLDVNYKRTLNKCGYAAIKRSYNNLGNEILRTYLDVNDKPVVRTRDGCAAVRAGYDGRGRGFEDNGCAAVATDYDNRGNASKWTCLDENKERRLNYRGHAILKEKYDELGNIVSWEYYDTSGNILASTTMNGE